MDIVKGRKEERRGQHIIVLVSLSVSSSSILYMWQG
mgnify:CR=1 FL=1